LNREMRAFPPCRYGRGQPLSLSGRGSFAITAAMKHINCRGGACSAQSGRGKQRPYTMGSDV
jgi:hypothetical protein